MANCPRCGQQIQENSLICPYCHERLGSGAPNAQRPTSAQSPNFSGAPNPPASRLGFPPTPNAPDPNPRRQASPGSPVGAPNPPGFVSQRPGYPPAPPSAQDPNQRRQASPTPPNFTPQRQVFSPAPPNAPESAPQRQASPAPPSGAPNPPGFAPQRSGFPTVPLSAPEPALQRPTSPAPLGGAVNPPDFAALQSSRPLAPGAAPILGAAPSDASSEASSADPETSREQAALVELAAVKDYLVHNAVAVFLTPVWGLILGGLGIVYAIRVGNAKARKDLYVAKLFSDAAKRCYRANMIIFLAFVALAFVASLTFFVLLLTGVITSKDLMMCVGSMMNILAPNM